MGKPTVFISYTHKNEKWKNRLVAQLGALQHEGLLDIWDDRRIGAGEDWLQLKRPWFRSRRGSPR